MKKIKKFLIVVIITAVVCQYIFYAGCYRVENLIDDIGEVTYKSSDKIEAANYAFDALDDNLKQHVKNYDVLIEARETYNDLVTIRDVINQITENGVSLIMKDDIHRAVNAFQSLSENQKYTIESSVLFSANETIDSLQRVEDVTNLIATVQIDNYGWIREKDVPIVKKARNQYDALSQQERAQITNFSDLLSYEEKIPPSWGAPVLSENEYWEAVAPKIKNLLNSHNLFIWDSYSIQPYFRLRVVYGKLNDDGTYSKKIIDGCQLDNLINQIRSELPGILYAYKLNRPSSIFNEPKQSIISIDFWETYVRNRNTGELAIKPYSSVQIDLLDLYFGEDRPILW